MLEIIYSILFVVETPILVFFAIIYWASSIKRKYMTEKVMKRELILVFILLSISIAMMILGWLCRLDNALNIGQVAVWIFCLAKTYANLHEVKRIEKCM